MSQRSTQTLAIDGVANRRNLLRGIGLSIGAAGLSAVAMQTASRRDDARLPGAPIRGHTCGTYRQADDSASPPEFQNRTDDLDQS